MLQNKLRYKEVNCTEPSPSVRVPWLCVVRCVCVCVCVWSVGVCECSKLNITVCNLILKMMHGTLTEGVVGSVTTATLAVLA
jgi:hypothetical protein